MNERKKNQTNLVLVDQTNFQFVHCLELMEGLYSAILLKSEKNWEPSRNSWSPLENRNHQIRKDGSALYIRKNMYTDSRSIQIRFQEWGVFYSWHQYILALYSAVLALVVLPQITLTSKLKIRKYYRNTAIVTNYKANVKYFRWNNKFWI